MLKMLTLRYNRLKLSLMRWRKKDLDYVCFSHISKNSLDYFFLNFFEIRSDLEAISMAPGDPSEEEGCEKRAARTRALS